MPDTFPARSRSALAPDTRSDGAVLGLFGPWRPAASLTLPIAERTRVALMRASGGTVPWQIAGKDEQGQPRSGHDHLYVLPFASVEGPGQPLDRVLLWARYGLEDSTTGVIEGLGARGGWIRLGGRPALRLELLGLGSREEISGCVPARVIGPGRVWESATSFVVPRFPKRRRGELVDGPQQQVSRLAEAVLGRVPREIRALDGQDERWGGFSQVRNKQPSEARRPASGWVLHFDGPVKGPVVLGHGAHYGLGRFEAQRSLP